MTNEEKAKELAGMENGINPIPAQRFVFDKCCEMAKWKDKQLKEEKKRWIEKAVEWLKENTSCYASFDDDIISDTENKNNFINDFKQVMKGE